MRISRIARQGAIDDSSASAGAFTEGRIAYSQIDRGEMSKNDGGVDTQCEIRCDFEHMPGFQDFLRGINRM